MLQLYIPARRVTRDFLEWNKPSSIAAATLIKLAVVCHSLYCVRQASVSTRHYFKSTAAQHHSSWSLELSWQGLVRCLYL